MAQPAMLIRPGLFPSYHCAKDAGILDKSFVTKMDRSVFIQNEAQIIGGGPDLSMAHSSVENLKGVGKKLAVHLGSRKFNGGAGIRTIADLATYAGGFAAPLQELKPGQVKLLESLRAALNACKNPGPAGRVGSKVSVTENDPTMSARMTPGREVLGHNQGADGYAELVLTGNPSNNGFVPSYLKLDFSSFAAPTRGGGMAEFQGFDVSVSASDSSMDTAQRLQAALAEKGLQADLQALPDLMHAPPSYRVQVRIWSPRAID